MAPPIDLVTPFEKGNGNQTCTYDECISFYRQLDAVYEEAGLLTYGTTSVGKPIHLLVISSDGNVKPEKIRASGKCVLLINNGIHPGEPDGIDASMIIARDLLSKRKLSALLDHVVIIIIPVYNVSGMLNRGGFSRANQNGPQEYGFRGTVQNYDLNRDFVKCDTRESQVFTEIFQEWNPEIFIDTHVSNGADYQYTMTLIPSQKDKLNPVLAAYQEKTLLPDLYVAMKSAGFETTPYVNSIEEIPDSGIISFLETPRFSTGYAALFNCIGMMPETHMLKPYSQRVQATYELILSVAKIVSRDHAEILQNKKMADEATKSQVEFTLKWIPDMSRFDVLDFKGYAAKYRQSEVSDSMRLWYDRSEPYNKPIKYFNHYKADVKVEKPFAYLIPQAWEQVIERMKRNGVAMKRLSGDTIMKADVYYIEDFKTTAQAYEGHYLHYGITVKSEKQTVQFYRGDYVVFTNQSCNRYIMEMLEPQATDSYFAWNFFDAILMEKEGFSDYVWDDTAASILRTDLKVKAIFEQKKKDDATFAKDSQAQLNFIYRHSQYFEKSFRRYPVYRINKEQYIPVNE